MPDFTQKKYILLLKALIAQGYDFQTFYEYLTAPSTRSIVLRHDVDKRPKSSLEIARIEHGLGLKGVYNFRARPESWDEGIIKEIASMGHEIGYHYEELCTHKGDHEKAFEDFKKNLERLRAIAPVNTITKHGSPRSKYDSSDLWKRYSYRELDITGEPYLDIDFSKMLYLTDTGRRWDGYRVSIRDKVNPEMYHELYSKGHPIHSTDDIIKAAGENALPDQIMINTHPQRWQSNGILWFSELVSQNLKNVVKEIMVKKAGR